VISDQDDSFLIIFAIASKKLQSVFASDLKVVRLRHSGARHEARANGALLMLVLMGLPSG
jgi:hypothetical protein